MSSPKNVLEKCAGSTQYFYDTTVSSYDASTVFQRVQVDVVKFFGFKNSPKRFRTTLSRWDIPRKPLSDPDSRSNFFTTVQQYRCPHPKTFWKSVPAVHNTFMIPMYRVMMPARFSKARRRRSAPPQCLDTRAIALRLPVVHSRQFRLS